VLHFTRYLAFNVMLRIAILSTPQSDSQKDLGKMITHLVGILEEIEKVEVDKISLSADKILPYTDYHHLVFCGTDHITYAHLHMAMSQTDPSETRIILYDEPGASTQRELNALFFRGSDQGRIPSSSLTRLLHSWSHRDLVAIAEQDVLKYGDGPESIKPATSSGSAKSTNRGSQRSSGARKVGVKGDTQARKRDASSGKNETGDKVGAQ